ncbi:MAG TPA: hypothetical protein VHK45_11160 [Geminicoccaceae bacterium]|jgi:hypothetical protein|nr:hypothetical protein [Geminicoccaceae bacterium]
MANAKAVAVDNKSRRDTPKMAGLSKRFYPTWRYFSAGTGATTITSTTRMLY